MSARTHARARAAGAGRALAAGSGWEPTAGAGRALALASCSWSPVTSGPKSPTKSVALSRAQRTFKGRAGEAPGKVFRSSAALALAAASVPYMVTKPKPRETFPSSTKTSPSTTWPYCANSAVRSPDANDSGSPSTKSVVFRRTRTAAAAAWTEVARDIRARARFPRARGASDSRVSLPLRVSLPQAPYRLLEASFCSGAFRVHPPQTLRSATTLSLVGAATLALGAMEGTLFRYRTSPGSLQAFMSPAEHAHARYVIYLGGLTDGLLACSYVEELAAECDRKGWAFVQPVIRSSYAGYGCSSLANDVADLTDLCTYLMATHDAAAFAVVGHSTGCQDIVQLLATAPTAVRERIRAVVLQAPVSDHPHPTLALTLTLTLTLTPLTAHRSPLTLTLTLPQAPVSDREAASLEEEPTAAARLAHAQQL